MSAAHFERLVDWIRTAYEVVPLSELTGRASSSGRGGSLRGLAALTFDDAYQGFFDHGLPVLSRLAVPATVFVVSSAPDRREAFWWDRLAEGASLSDAERARHLDENRGAAHEVLQAAGAVGAGHVDSLPTALLPASWETVGEGLREEGLLAVGSHTATHPNLTRMDDDELERELTEPRERIASVLGVEPDVVSYPYGLHDDRVREAAARAGYRAGLTLDGGHVGPGCDLLGIPRLNVPASIGVHALECWAAGLGPFHRS